jgi:hypothetical protein
MRKGRFSAEQINNVLKEHQVGIPVCSADNAANSARASR